MVAVDLVLTVAAFVMAVLRAHAHLLHSQADVPAEVLACVQRGHVKVAAKVDGDTGGAAPVIILPWRPTEGRVMQFFCDVEKPDGQPFGGNCRGFLRSVNRKFKKLGSCPSAP